MREIKFRALKDDVSDCTFKYGQLVYDAIGRTRISVIDSSGEGLQFYTCISGTEGQYTGLKDRNGKEIYEGDIVKWGHIKGGEENPIRIANVVLSPDIQFHILNHNMNFLGQNKVFHYGSFIYTDTEKWLEIIGNVHENPELITKEKSK